MSFSAVEGEGEGKPTMFGKKKRKKGKRRKKKGKKSKSKIRGQSGPGLESTEDTEDGEGNYNPSWRLSTLVGDIGMLIMN